MAVLEGEECGKVWEGVGITCITLSRTPPPHTQIGFAKLRHYLVVLHTSGHTHTHAQIGFPELRHYLIVLSKDWDMTGSFDGQW